MTKPFDVTLVTCQHLPEPDPDEAPLNEALTNAGLAIRTCVWNDPDVEWSQSTITIMRSTWDYHRQRDAFIHWAGAVDSVSPLFNSPGVVRWNSHKSYLLQLPLRGVPVVPTVLVERGSNLGLSKIAENEEWQKLVVKPAVSAASFETHVMTADNLDEDTFQRLTAAEDVLVQPYIDSVDDHGEHSLIFIDGEFTHCVRKNPRFAGQDENVTGPHPPTSEELSVAQRAIMATGEALLYARVDLVLNAQQSPVVAELEFIEPSLFLTYSDHALNQFVKAITKRVVQRSTSH